MHEAQKEWRSHLAPTPAGLTRKTGQQVVLDGELAGKRGAYRRLPTGIRIYLNNYSKDKRRSTKITSPESTGRPPRQSRALRGEKRHSHIGPILEAPVSNIYRFVFVEENFKGLDRTTKKTLEQWTFKNIT